MVCSMLSVFILLITVFSAFVGWQDLCYEIFDLTTFESLISIIGILSSCSLRTDGYCDLSLMLSSHLYRTKVFYYDSLICDFMSLK